MGEVKGVTIEGVRFLRIPEVAKILNLSPQSVRNYIKTGQLKGYRIGLPIFITEKSLHEFIKSREL